MIDELLSVDEDEYAQELSYLKNELELFFEEHGKTEYEIRDMREEGIKEISVTRQPLYVSQDLIVVEKGKDDSAYVAAIDADSHNIWIPLGDDPSSADKSRVDAYPLFKEFSSKWEHDSEIAKRVGVTIADPLSMYDNAEEHFEPYEQQE